MEDLSFEIAQAQARAEDAFRQAEKHAEEGGRVDAQKWCFVAGYLQQQLANAYLGVKDEYQL